MGIDLSILIVTWNAKKFAVDFIRSIYTHTQGISFEVIVADNHSEDDTVASIRETFPEVRILENKCDGGFAYGINKCIDVSRGRYVVIFTPDTLLRSNSMKIMVDFMDRTPSAGACGARLFYFDGSPQQSYGTFPGVFRMFVHLFPLHRMFPSKWFRRFKRLSVVPSDTIKDAIEVDYPLGACLMVRRKVIEAVGKLDEQFFVFCEETDWCYRMKEFGFTRYYVPQAEVLHYCGGSFQGADLQRQILNLESKFKFFRKHYPWYKVLLLCGMYIVSCSFRILYWHLVGAMGLMKHYSKGKAEYAQKTFSMAIRQLRVRNSSI